MRTLPFAASTLALSAALAVALEIHSPSRIDDYEVDRERVHVSSLTSAVLQHRQTTGSLPASLDQALEDPSERLLHDPWHRSYVYRRGSAGKDGFVVYSTGKDGIDQGGAGDDIVAGVKQHQCIEYGVDCPLPTVTWLKIGAVLAFVLSAIVVLAALAWRVLRWKNRKASKA